MTCAAVVVWDVDKSRDLSTKEKGRPDAFFCRCYRFGFNE